MRIAYLLKANLIKQHHLIEKVFNQVHYWTNSNMYSTEVKIFCLSETDSSSSKLDAFDINYYKVGKGGALELLVLTSLLKDVLLDLKAFNPDLVYTRTWTPRIFTMKFVRNFKVISEVNTKELDEYRLLAKNSLKLKLKFIYYRYTRHLFYNHLSSIFCVTNEIAKGLRQYKLPTFVTPNSIPLKNYKIEIPEENKIPKIFFIGTTGMPWQGFDIIIKLAILTLGKLEFHLVGNNELDDGTLPQNVVSYGFLDKKDYVAILNKCDVGLGTMALHRKGLKEACPLKIREYLAYGLPIILPYDDTAFLEDNPIWALKLPSEEGASLEPDQIERIVTFSNKMLGYRVAHEESSKYVDSTYWEKKRIDFFRSVMENQASHSPDN